MNAVTLSQAEGDDITVSNDFRQIGLVVDPTTYGTSTVASSTTARQTYVVKASSSSGTFEADEVITQTSTGAVGRVVEWDSTLSLFIINKRDFLITERVQQIVDTLHLVEQTQSQVLHLVLHLLHQVQLKLSHLQMQTHLH